MRHTRSIDFIGPVMSSHCAEPLAYRTLMPVLWRRLIDSSHMIRSEMIALFFCCESLGSAYFAVVYDVNGWSAGRNWSRGPPIELLGGQSAIGRVMNPRRVCRPAPFCVQYGWFGLSKIQTFCGVSYWKNGSCSLGQQNARAVSVMPALAIRPICETRGIGETPLLWCMMYANAFWSMYPIGSAS